MAVGSGMSQKKIKSLANVSCGLGFDPNYNRNRSDFVVITATARRGYDPSSLTTQQKILKKKTNFDIV